MQISELTKRNIYNTSLKMYDEGHNIKTIVRFIYLEYKKTLGLEFTRELCNEWVWKSLYSRIMAEGVS